MVIGISYFWSLFHWNKQCNTKDPVQPSAAQTRSLLQHIKCSMACTVYVIYFYRLNCYSLIPLLCYVRKQDLMVCLGFHVIEVIQRVSKTNKWKKSKLESWRIVTCYRQVLGSWDKDKFCSLGGNCICIPATEKDSSLRAHGAKICSLWYVV